MNWNGPERVNKSPEKSGDCCASWEEHQRETEAKRNALKTPLSLNTGYDGDPIDPGAAINREPWTRG